MAPSSINVFVAETPFQVLNGEEAIHFFNFSNNHLIIVLGFGISANFYKSVVRHCCWDSVRFIIHRENLVIRRPGFLGKVFYQMQRIRYNIRQYNNRKRFDRLAASFSNVQNLVLGNYSKTRKPYLCHFALALKPQRLYIIDDGTDVIKVNDELTAQVYPLDSAERFHESLTPWKRLKRYVNKTFVDWNDFEAKNVTFFTAFDLKVRPGDRWIKHDYSCLQKRLADSAQSSQVLFLGQTMIEDDLLEREVYFEYLRKIRSFFVNEELIYVPHYRESSETVRYVRENLGFGIERPDLPIECHLAWKGPRPKILASFCCSALANCSVIFGKHLKIMAFYITPEKLLKDREFMEEVYSDLRERTNESLQVVDL